MARPRERVRASIRLRLYPSFGDSSRASSRHASSSLSSSFVVVHRSSFVVRRRRRRRVFFSPDRSRPAPGTHATSHAARACSSSNPRAVFGAAVALLVLRLRVHVADGPHARGVGRSGRGSATFATSAAGRRGASRDAAWRCASASRDAAFFLARVLASARARFTLRKSSRARWRVSACAAAVRPSRTRSPAPAAPGRARPPGVDVPSPRARRRPRPRSRGRLARSTERAARVVAGLFVDMARSSRASKSSGDDARTTRTDSNEPRPGKSRDGPF